MPDGGVNPARSGAMTHTNTEWSLGGLSGLDCMPDQRCLHSRPAPASSNIDVGMIADVRGRDVQVLTIPDRALP